MNGSSGSGASAWPHANAHAVQRTGRAVQRVVALGVALVLLALAGAANADQCFTAFYDYGRKSVPLKAVTKDPLNGNADISDSLQWLTRGSYAVTGATATYTGYEERDTEVVMVTRDTAGNLDVLLIHDQNNTDTDGFNFQLQVTVMTQCTAQGVCSQLMGNSTILAAAFQNTPYLTGSGLPPQQCALSPSFTYAQASTNFSRGQCCPQTGSCCGASTVCGQFDECIGAGTFYVYKEVNPTDPKQFNAALWLGHLPTAAASNDFCINLEYSHLSTSTPGISRVKFVTDNGLSTTMTRSATGNSISICSKACAATGTIGNYCSRYQDCGSCSTDATSQCSWCSSGCQPTGTCAAIACPTCSAQQNCGDCLAQASAGCGWCADMPTNSPGRCIPGNRATGFPLSPPAACERWVTDMCPNPEHAPAGVLPSEVNTRTDVLFPLYQSNFQSNLIGWSVADVSQPDTNSPVFSQWLVSDGYLIQSSTIRAQFGTADAAGTWFYYQPGKDSQWVSYSVTAQLKSTGENYFSVAVRWTSETSYYEFEWANANPLQGACRGQTPASNALGLPLQQLRTMRLKRRTATGTTVLQSKTVGYDRQTRYTVQIVVFETFTATGGARDATQLIVFLDSGNGLVHQWTLEDNNADRPLQGTVAASTAGEAGASFGTFTVSMIATPLNLPSGGNPSADTTPLKGPLWSYYTFQFDPVATLALPQYAAGFVFSVQLANREAAPTGLQADINAAGGAGSVYSAYDAQMYLHYGGGSSSQAALPTPSNYRAAQRVTLASVTTLTMSVPSAAFLSNAGPWYVGVYNPRWTQGVGRPYSAQTFQLTTSIVAIQPALAGFPNVLTGQSNAVNLYSVNLAVSAGFLQFQVTRRPASDSTVGTALRVLVSVGGTTGSGFPPSPSLDSRYDFSDDHTGSQDNTATYFGGTLPPLTVRIPNPTTGQYYVSVFARSTTGPASAVPASLAVPFNLTVTVPNPTIVSINPIRASTDGGSPLTIIGFDFFSGDGSKVLIGGRPCVVQSLTTDYTATQIACSLPAGQGANQTVVVVTGAGLSNPPSKPVYFSYLAPLVQAINPFNAPTTANFTVTITGQNFGADTSTVVVRVGGALCPIVPGAQPRSTILCTLPPGQGASQPLQVVVAGQSGVAGSVATFAYDPPVVSSISPLHGASENTLLTIYGSNFGAQPFSNSVSATSSYVLVGGKVCDFTAANTSPTSTGHNQITCKVPAGVGRKNLVLVSVYGQTSNTQLFDYDAPVVVQVTPRSGPTTGLRITISGYNFGPANVTDFAVTLYNVATTINTPCKNAVHANDSHIFCDAPAGTGVNLLAQVTVVSQDSVSGVTPAYFSYAAPVVTGVSPASNGRTVGGDLISISGSNFGPTPISGVLFVPLSVTVGGASCPVYTQFHTNVTCIAPAGTGSNPVLVTVDGQTSAVNAASVFNYAAATVSGINPPSGGTAGGIQVTIGGTNFGPSSSSGVALVGGNVCVVQFPQQWTDTQIVCTLPAGAGVANVQVNITGQLSPVLVTFTYTAPAVSAMSPSHGPTLGPLDSNPANWVVLSLVGTNFGAVQGSVKVGATRTCVVTSWSHTLVLCTVPAGEGSALTVTLTDAVGQNAASPTLWSYDAPVITGYVGPIVSTLATVVTVQGYNFGDRSFGGAYSGALVTPCYSIDEFDANTVQNGAWSYTYDTNAFSQGVVFDDGQAPKDGSNTILFSADQLPTGSGQYQLQIVTTTRALSPAQCSSVSVTLFNGLSVSQQSVTITNGVGVFGGGPFTLAGPGQVKVRIDTAGITPCTVAIDAVRFCPNVQSNAVTWASDVVSHTHTQLVVNVAAGVGTDYTFAFTAPHGASTVAANLFNATSSFSRAPPTVATVSAALLSVNTSNTLTFTGSGFGVDPNAVAVWVGRLGDNATLCSGVTALSDTSFACTTKPWSVGGTGVAVWVQVGGQRADTSAITVSFVAPNITLLAQGCGGTAPLNVVTQPNPFRSQKTFALIGSFPGASLASVEVQYGVPTGQFCPSTGTANCPQGYWWPIQPANVVGATGQCLTVKNEVDSSGVNLKFRVRINGGAWSAPYPTGPWGLNFFVPQMISSTIRQNVNSTIGLSALYDNSTQGNWVTFDMFYMPTNAYADAVTITYSNGINTYPCESVEIYTRYTIGYYYYATSNPDTRSAVRCKTTPGTGSNFVFTVSILNTTSVTGNDKYSYTPLVAPVVTSVRGCGTDDPSGFTTGCLTSQSTPLTVNGQGFCDFAAQGTTCSVTVKVGPYDCTSPASLGTTGLTCTLPAGTGVNMPVVVIMDGNFSPANASVTVSHAAAVVTAVDAPAPCTKVTAGSVQVLTNCPTAYALASPTLGNTNVNLTITGQNFGSAGATVLIGSQTCSGVQHVGHTTIYCQMPPGTGMEGDGQSLSITVVPVGGGTTVAAPAGTVPTISYGACPTGYFRVVDSRGRQLNSTCSACPLGTYSAGASTTACLQCESGSYGPVIGLSACALCGAGNFSVRSTAGLGATACTSCAPGQYSTAPSSQTQGNSYCQPCPVNTFCSGYGTIVYTQCPANQVSSGGAVTCSVCPIGTTFQGSAATGVCVPVPVGRFGSIDGSGNRISQACPPGSIAPYAGMQSCTVCANGTATGSTPLPTGGYATCFPCNSGFYQPNANATSCLQCPVGKSRRNDGRPAIACDICVAGTYQNGQTAAGVAFAPTEGPVTCLKCEKGTFQNVSTATGCIACPAGRANRFLGATTCALCPVGSYAEAPSTAVGLVQCRLCPTGKFGDAEGLTSDTACKPCGASVPGITGGEYQDVTGQSSCKPCPVGRYTSQTNQAGCLPCNPGYAANAPGATTCSACQQGTWAGAGASACVNALPGFKVAAVNQGSSVACSPGTFSANPAAGSCQDCAAGKYATNSGSSSCEDCPKGWYAPSGVSAACTICSAGTFSNVTASTLCYDCPIGTYQPSNGGTTCVSCPTGTFGEQTRQQTCAACSTGYYSDTLGQTYCKSCVEGQYQPQLGSTYCRSCPAGTFTDAPNKPSCTPCSAGQFANVTGSRECGRCVAGRYSVLPKLTLDSVDKSIVNLGPTACTPCPPGSSTAADSSGSCQLCGAGKFSNVYGSPTCEECSPGRHASVEGQPNCQLCPAGTSSIAPSSIECTVCPAGYYQSAQGRENCTNCEPGKFRASPGGSICADCPVGKFSLGTSTSCSDCKSGTYQNEPGKTTCPQCPKGYAQPGTGASICQACQPRYAAESPGQASCDACKPGSYAANYNTTECPPCPSGSFQGSNGQSTCPLCSPGTWSAVGATTCPACTDPAKFSDINGATACSQCPTNQLANDAHTSCECQPGLFFGYPFSVYEGQPLGSTQNEYDAIAQRMAAELSASSGRNVTIAQDCQPCPDGADCRVKGTRYLSMGTLPGWWRADNQTLTFYQCLQMSMCMGGRASTCGMNRHGPICAVCDDGSLVNSRGDCVPCNNSRDTYIGLTVMIIALIILAMVVMFFLVIRSDRPQMRFVRLQQKLAHEEEMVRHGGLKDDAGAGSASPKDGNTTLSAGATSPTAGNGNTTATAGDVALIPDPKAGSSPASPSNAAASANGKGARVEGADGKSGVFNEDGEFVTDSYRPTPRPNLTYKLKVLVGFFQVATNITYTLNMPWPVTFREFIAGFAFFNLDFTSWASIGCLANINYYTHLVIATVIPFVIIAAIVLFYFLPYYWTHRPGSTPPNGVSKAEHAWAMDAARKRQRRRVWKLVLFTLFLVYPRVCAIVLSMYVCQTVEGTTFVQSDFTQICYDSTWMSYLGWNIVCIVIYPIGVPLFFLYLLMRYRKRLNDPSVRVELGFLYDGYDKDAWYFELLDMTHKLILSAILPFFPLEAQMPVGFCVVVLYMIIILLRKPYTRKSDDRLHLFAQVELLLILIAGYVFYKADVDNYGAFENDLLGSFLIIVVCFFILAFLAQSVRIVQKMLQRSIDGTVDPDTVVVDQMDDGTRKRAVGMLSALARLTGKTTRKQGVRHTAPVPRPKFGAASGGAASAVELGPVGGNKEAPRDSDVLMQRNPLAAKDAANTTADANTTATVAASPADGAAAAASAAADAAPQNAASVEGASVVAAVPAADAAAVATPIVLVEVPANQPVVSASDVNVNVAGAADGSAVVAVPVVVAAEPLVALAAMPVVSDAQAAAMLPAEFVPNSSAAPPPFIPAAVAVDAAPVPVEGAPAAAAAAAAAAPEGVTGAGTPASGPEAATAAHHDSDSDEEHRKKSRRRKDSDE